MSTDNPQNPSRLYELDKLEDVPVQIKDQQVIPIIEEKAVVGKEVVETGRVRLLKTVEEHEETISVPLTEEGISVERKAIGTYVNEVPTVRSEGDTTIYSVVKEVLVVEKKLMLVEEIHVTKRQRTTTNEETISLRTEKINVEHETINSERPG